MKVATLFLTTVFASLALAQQSGYAPPEPIKTPDKNVKIYTKQHHRKPDFNQLDLNKDGVITDDEMHAALEYYFGDMDKNKDGKITKEELDAGYQARREYKVGQPQKNRLPAIPQ